MFDVNILLDDAINENRNLNDGEIYLVKENEYLNINQMLMISLIEAY